MSYSVVNWKIYRKHRNFLNEYVIKFVSPLRLIRFTRENESVVRHSSSGKLHRDTSLYQHVVQVRGIGLAISGRFVSGRPAV